MSGYWYFQTSEESRWLHVEDSANAESEIRRQGATKVAVLKISQLVGDDSDIYTDKFDLKYSGPLYFDIDCGESDDLITMAIESSRALVRNLLAAGVEEKAISVVLSGKKGLHVLVDQRAVSGTNGMVPALPAVYRKIAEKFYVEGMDFQVYSARRGNTFRLVNMKREGVGTYPVHVTVPELMELTVASYREFVTGPRFVPERPEKVKRCDSLYEDYKWARERVNAEGKKEAERIPMTNAAIEVLKSHEPPCMEHMRKGKRHVSATYNQLGNQAGAYARIVGMDRAHRRSLGLMIADSTPSNSGKSQKERRRLVTAGLETVVNRPNYVWSCGAMRKVLDKPPCEDCAVKEHWDAAQAEHATAAISILELHSQYFSAGAEDKLARLTNFVLDPVHVVVEQPADPTLPERRISTRFQVLTPKGRYGFIDMDDNAFTSKGAFTKQLTGHGNLCYWGSDNQVQSLREYMFSEDKMNDTAKVVQVSQAGMHVVKIPGSDEFLKVFVEPGFSIDSRNKYGTHTLHKPQGSLTDYRAVNRLKFENEEAQTGKLLLQEEVDGLSDAIVTLFSMAHPVVMSQLVGWMVSTHLKQHIAAITHQFPTLMFWGPAGAGKTTTMKIVAGLAGLDKSEGMIVAANTAKSGFAIRTLMCTSTTQPRLFDEFNLNELDSDLASKILQAIKLAWDASSWTQGALDRTEGGTTLESNGLTAPCVFMGEQDIRGVPEETAIAHRSIQVFFTQDMRPHKDDVARAMMQKRPWLVKLSYALMKSALWQRPEDVFKWRDKYIEWTPAALPDRPRVAYATVFMGLEFLRLRLTEMGVKQEALDCIVEAVKALRLHINENAKEIATSKSKTQVTNMMSEIAAYMAIERFRQDVNAAPALTADEEHLYILPPALHTTYRVFCRSTGHNPVIPNLSTFLQLLEQEKYILDMRYIESGILNGRPCVKIDMKKLKDAGVDTIYFRK